MSNSAHALEGTELIPIAVFCGVASVLVLLGGVWLSIQVASGIDYVVSEFGKSVTELVARYPQAF